MLSPERLPRALAAGIGVAVWLAIALVSGKAEAWDSALYWVVGLPLLYMACLALGWFFPARAWEHGPVALLSQGVPLLLFNLSSWSMLPFGALFLGLLSAPAAGIGALGAWARRKSLEAGF